jgi:cytochrome oxidase Cu insertion factor (SCO1/SenC/PrrC family)
MSRFSRSHLLIVGLLAVVAGLWVANGGTGRAVTLGPVDGHELPPIDLERVRVGHVAPDFSLRSLSGEVVTLSDFRGRHNVVLVFYRGHW